MKHPDEDSSHKENIHNKKEVVRRNSGLQFTEHRQTDSSCFLKQ